MEANERDSGKRWLTTENAVFGVASLSAVGVIALYWWSSGKISHLESENAKLSKRLDKLEAKCDAQHKKTTTTLSRHGVIMSDLRQDIDSVQVQLDTLHEEPEDNHQARGQKKPKSKPWMPSKKTSRSSYTDDDLSGSDSEIDYDALYTDLEEEEKRSKRGRKR